MKKTYQLENLCCANCAAKIERAVQRIPGVRGAAVSFLTGRMTLEADDALWDAVTAAAAKAVTKIEPDCRMVER